MVLHMARPKYKKSTIWRCCKKMDSQGEHFTGIHDRFSEIQFIVNHNSQSDGHNKSAKRWTNLQKKTIHFISLQRNRENTNDNGISPWTGQAKMGPWNFDPILYQKLSTPRVRRKSWRAYLSRTIQEMASLFKDIVVGQVWMELEMSS